MREKHSFWLKLTEKKNTGNKNENPLCESRCTSLKFWHKIYLLNSRKSVSGSGRKRDTLMQYVLF